MRRKCLVAILATFCVVGYLLAAVPAKAEEASVSIGVGDTILRVSGKTSPGAFVTISRDGNVIGTTTAHGTTGVFTQTFIAQPPGLHQLTIYAQSLGGDNTDSVTVSVNIPEHTTTTVDVFLPSTLKIKDSSLAIGQRLELSGESFPSSAVSIYIDNSTYTVAFTNAQGLWSSSIDTSALLSGQHEVFVKVTDSLGEQSYPTSPRQFSLEARPSVPQVPIPSQPGQVPSIPRITYPVSGSTIRQPTISVQGTADANTQIEIWEGGQVIGSVWSDAYGRWHFDMRLEPKGYAIKARACLLGVCSGFSPIVYFNYAPGGSVSPLEKPLHMAANQYSFCVYKDELLIFEAFVLDGQPPFETTLRWGDGAVETGKSLHSALRFTHRYSETGLYSGMLDVKDAQGRTGRAQFTVQVRERFNAVNFTVLSLFFWFLLALLIWLLTGYRRRRKKTTKKEKHTPTVQK